MNNVITDEKEKINKPFGISLLSADVFHTDDEEIERIPWNKLSIETRVQKLKEYFEQEFNHDKSNKKVSKETMDNIIEMVEQGKLHLKKEVSYDEVNGRIIKLFYLVPESKHNQYFYVYRPEKISIREKSKKSARSKLFRKGR